VEPEKNSLSIFERPSHRNRTGGFNESRSSPLLRH
jgi:hypothetical protein